MIQIGGANFENMEEVEKEFGLFLGLSLSDEERNILNEKWIENGGRKVIPWYKWVLQNVKIVLDI